MGDDQGVKEAKDLEDVHGGTGSARRVVTVGGRRGEDTSGSTGRGADPATHGSTDDGANATSARGALDTVHERGGRAGG